MCILCGSVDRWSTCMYRIPCHYIAFEKQIFISKQCTMKHIDLNYILNRIQITSSTGWHALHWTCMHQMAAANLFWQNYHMFILYSFKFLNSESTLYEVLYYKKILSQINLNILILCNSSVWYGKCRPTVNVSVHRSMRMSAYAHAHMRQLLVDISCIVHKFL